MRTGPRFFKSTTSFPHINPAKAVRFKRVPDGPGSYGISISRMRVLSSRAERTFTSNDRNCRCLAVGASIDHYQREHSPLRGVGLFLCVGGRAPSSWRCGPARP